MKSTIAYLDGNDGKALLALGEKNRFLVSEDMDNLDDMQSFIDQHSGNFIFMGLSYDLKNHLLGITSKNPDFTELPAAFFWVPEVVIELKKNVISRALQGEINNAVQKRVSSFLSEQNRNVYWNAQMKSRTSKDDYLTTIGKLQEAIQYGSIYEVNYCQEFFDDNFELSNAEAAFFRLNEITQAPFSTYLAFDEFNILCGSPERFLEKKGDNLRSQPIKGTRKRSEDPETDKQLKADLLNDPKERAENVMIVDLVRNDLSRVAQKSSVSVEELFGVYTFNTVHQLISTVSCNIKEGTSFLEILKATFPMGSMTGAPKRSAMKLIDEHENFRRGWYSGSIGYISPNGDFDMNVVIRTIIYNQRNKYLSCAVGGAITIQSTPEAEFEECNVKVRTILARMQSE